MLFEGHVNSSDLQTQEALKIIKSSYDLDPNIDLSFSYKTYNSTGTKTKWIRWSDGFFSKNRKITNKDGSVCDLGLDDILLFKNIKPGTLISKDTTCDSEFMMRVVRDIGTAIRASFHWVDKKIPIFLFMDNAGGHGTNKTKKEYTRILKDEFNVQVEFQVANSPELNMLDLGAWMAIQSEVEEIHKNCTMQYDVLAGSINTAFENLDDSILTRIHDCWVKVLKIIIQSAGDNQQVDKFRGDA